MAFVSFGRHMLNVFTICSVCVCVRASVCVCVRACAMQWTIS